ncbi:uncharacterized protein LOC143010588 [Genypterus blacodes]|uniref:uncharacterized protein LOC143010588 n=1 Tax=Genypterus blacodes TaxID=154954 RepID=UPI003F775031
MEVTTLCIALSMNLLTLMAVLVQHSFAQKDSVLLDIVPASLQHFEYDTVSFVCKGTDRSSGWRVMDSMNRSTSECKAKAAKSTPFNCTFELYATDSGTYWCEAEKGRKSTTVNITVTAGSVILMSPVVPVVEGASVTLRCKNKKAENVTADFYKDGTLLVNKSKGELVFYAISKSDEGFYKCHISGAGESAESWLSVKGVTGNSGSSYHMLLWIAVSVLLVTPLMMLVGLIHHLKHRGGVTANPELHTMVLKDRKQRVSAEQSAAEYVDTYAIISKDRRDKDTADTAENLKKQKPQSQKGLHPTDEDESPSHLLYSAVTFTKRSPTFLHQAELSTSSVTLKDPPSADKETNIQPSGSYPSVSAALRWRGGSMDAAALCVAPSMQVFMLLLMVTQSSLSEQTQATTVSNRLVSDSASTTRDSFIKGVGCLAIVASRLQVFEYGSVSFTCEGIDGFSGCTVARSTGGEPSACTFSWGVSAHSRCDITTAYPEDSGEYWCEARGQRTNTVNITVSGGSVILESPVLPVMEGDSVTLRCVNRTNASGLSASFYKDGFFIGMGATGSMTLHSVSKLLEGFYMCRIFESGSSPKSWMTVRGGETSPFDPPRQSCNVYVVVRTVFTVLLVALLLVLLGCLYRAKRKYQPMNAHWQAPDKVKDGNE